MPCSLRRHAIAALAALTLAACGDSTTAPQSVDAELEALLGAQFATLGGSAFHGQPPYLGGLMRQAVAQVRQEHGDEAARSLVAPLRDLMEQGRSVRESGDRNAMHAHIEQVRALTAEIVVSVLGGGVVDEALTKAADVVSRLEAALAERQAAGQPVPRFEQAVERAREEYAAAAAARDAGSLAEALDHAARVIDFGYRARAAGARRGGRGG